MQRSHEVPKCLMEQSREFNDYDYALVHKFEDDKEYLEFYKESLRMGRTVILDNSLFELEEMFDHDEFAKWVTELGNINPKNFYYIIPDVLEEKTKTIESAKSFLIKYPDLPGNKIGVVQGKNYREILECFLFMQQQSDRVAISFDYSWYEEMFPYEKTKWHSWMKGRQQLMYRLYIDDVIDECFDGIHLLGCGLPQEFEFYKRKEFDSIVTVDTSNPIVMGMHGHRYDKVKGLEFKESIKLVELFDAELDDKQLEDINHNLDVFKSFSI